MKDFKPGDVILFSVDMMFYASIVSPEKFFEAEYVSTPSVSTVILPCDNVVALVLDTDLNRSSEWICLLMASGSAKRKIIWTHLSCLLTQCEIKQVISAGGESEVAQ